ncbi:MAG: LacI family DNA-binding transcriptional regulator [Lachnospiraceae bacterium]|nr:LacI family DNA-binding transcriptional regulator [Lachnospiraceae bacterium]
METVEKKLTIADVADYLGVSKTTVSRAISGKGRVSEETRKRVQQYIDRMDYKPNVIAKGLAQSKTFNIAVLLPADCDMQELPFFQNCMCGICDAAAKRDYDVLAVYTTAGGLGGLDRIIANHKVDGVVLTRTLVEDAAADYLKARNIPVVAVGSSTDADLIQIDHDHRSACQELTMHLLKQGIRKVGMIGGNESHVVTRNRFGGFADAFRMMDLPVDMSFVYFGVEKISEIEQAVEELLEKKAECIVCMDDMICNHVIHKLREVDVNLLNTVKVASFYGGVSGSILAGRIETVEFDAKKLGFVTCNTLLDVIGGKQIAVKQLLPYKLRTL